MDFVLNHDSNLFDVELKHLPLHLAYNRIINLVYCGKDYSPNTRLYFLDFGYFYKIGITKRSIEERFSNYRSKYTILDSLYLEYKDARYLEKKFLGLVGAPIHKPGNKSLQEFKKLGGWTECFRKTKSTSFHELVRASKNI